MVGPTPVTDPEEFKLLGLDSTPAPRSVEATSLEATPTPVSEEEFRMIEEAPDESESATPGAMVKMYTDFGDKVYEFVAPADAPDEELKRLGYEAVRRDLPNAAIGTPVVSREIGYGMFKNMSDEQAEEYYQQWVDSPTTEFEYGNKIEKDPKTGEQTKTGKGRLVHTDPATGNKMYVPAPDLSMFNMGDPQPGVFSKIDDGLDSAARNVTKFGASIVDLLAMGAATAANKVGIPVDPNYNPNLTGAVDRNLPAFPGDSFVVTATELLSGASMGGPVRGVLTKGLQIEAAKEATSAVEKKLVARATAGLKSTAETIKRAAPAEIRMAAASNDKSDTLLVGENAALDISKGFNPKDDASAATQNIAAKANILIDVAMVAPIASKVVEGVSALSLAVWGLFRPAAKLFFDDVVYRDAVRGINERLGTILSPDGKPSKETLQELTRLINENEKILVGGPARILSEIEDPIAKKAITDALNAGDIATASKLFGELPSKPSPTSVSALEAAEQPNMVVPVDTMTALNLGVQKDYADTEVGRMLSSSAGAERAGRITRQGYSGQLIAKDAEIPLAIERTLTGIEQARGGTDAIQGAKDAIVKPALDVVAQTDEALGLAQRRLGTAERAVVQRIKEDPILGSKLDQLFEATGITINAAKIQAEDAIVGNLTNALVAQTGTKDMLFSRIVGGDVDAEGLVGLFKNVPKDIFDMAGRAMYKNPIASEFVRVARPRVVDAIDDVGNVIKRPETDGEIFERMSQFIHDNRLDYGRLYREIRPELSRAAESLYAKQDTVGGRAIRDVIKWIDGPALDHVIATGDREVADAALAAKDYYANTFAKFWRDGDILEQFADEYSSTVNRGFNEPAFNQAASNLIRTPLEIGDNSRFQITAITDALRTPEGGQNPSLVFDWRVGQAISELGVDILAGKSVGDIPVQSFLRVVSDVSETFGQQFPEKMIQLREFANYIVAAKGNVELQQRIIATAEEASAAAKETLFSGALTRFFNAEGVVNPNGYAVMEGIFNSKQSAGVLSELMDKATDDPIIRDGIQAAYARFLQSKVLNQTRTAGGSRAINVSQIEQMEDGLKPILDYGAIVFRDTPGATLVINDLLNVAGVVTQFSRAKPIASDSSTAVRTQARDVANRVITAQFGVLNRFAAVLRGIVNTGINKISDETKIERLFDTLSAEPEVFVKYANQLITRENRGDAAKYFVTKILRPSYQRDGAPNQEGATGIGDTFMQTDAMLGGRLTSSLETATNMVVNALKEDEEQLEDTEANRTVDQKTNEIVEPEYTVQGAFPGSGVPEIDELDGPTPE